MYQYWTVINNITLYYLTDEMKNDYCVTRLHHHLIMIVTILLLDDFVAWLICYLTTLLLDYLPKFSYIVTMFLIAAKFNFLDTSLPYYLTWLYYIGQHS